MNKPIIAADLFAVHIRRRIKTFNLSSKGRVQIGWIKQGNGSDAAATLHNALPQGWHIKPQRANRAHTSHNYTLPHGSRLRRNGEYAPSTLSRPYYTRADTCGQ